MPLKALFAIVAVLAVAAGFALPAPHHAEARQVSQFQTIELND